MDWRPAPHWIYMMHYAGQNMTTEASDCYTVYSTFKPRMGENTTLQREKLSAGKRKSEMFCLCAVTQLHFC